MMGRPVIGNKHQNVMSSSCPDFLKMDEILDRCLDRFVICLGLDRLYRTARKGES